MLAANGILYIHADKELLGTGHVSWTQVGEISLEIRSDDDELLLESKIQKYRQCCRTEYASENKGTRIEWLAEGEDSDRERHFVLDFPVGSPGLDKLWELILQK